MSEKYTPEKVAELVADNRKWVQLHRENKYQREAAKRMTCVLDALEAEHKRAEEARFAPCRTRQGRRGEAMTDFTPTTGNIQDAYCHVRQEVLGERGDSAHERFHAEFARWLDAHDAEVRAEANPAVVEVTDERVEAARIAIHVALAPRWMSVVDALAGDQGEYMGMLGELARAALEAALSTEVGE